MATKAKEIKNYQGINLYTMKVRVQFTTPILGSSPQDPEIYVQYIADKVDAVDNNMSAEEAAAIAQANNEDEKGMTVFPRDDKGNPIFWNYQWRGFFKEACSMLRKDGDKRSSLITAFKKEIDGRIFIKERMIPIKYDGVMSDCQRPLRASTAQGERIALAHSETIPAGAMCEFTVGVMDEKMLDTVEEWLSYGSSHGMGQWRNSGRFGTFMAKTLRTGSEPIANFNKQVGYGIDVDAFYAMDMTKPLFD